MLSKKTHILIFFLYLINLLFSQSNKTIIPDTISLTQYDKFLWGENWAPLWELPVKIKIVNVDSLRILSVIDKDRFELKFRNKNGKEFLFKSLQKKLNVNLPDEIKKNILPCIIEKQKTSNLPFAEIFVASIFQSLQIDLKLPTIVFLNGENINSVRFQKRIGLFSEIEKSNIISSKCLFNLFENKNLDIKIDNEKYLKIRMIEMLLGIWDENDFSRQWKINRKDKMIFAEPLPSEGKSFESKFDGVFPTLAKFFAPQIGAANSNERFVKNVTWAARHLDKIILSSLTKQKWDSVYDFIKVNFTEDKIDKALDLLPKSYSTTISKQIKSKLIFRIKNLKTYSNEYYRQINKTLNIWLPSFSKRIEFGNKNNKLEISVVGSANKINIYRKPTDANLTEEICIYLNKGDDEIFINDNLKNIETIRLIATKGVKKIGATSGNKFTQNCKFIFYRSDSSKILSKNINVQIQHYSKKNKSKEIKYFNIEENQNDFKTTIIPIGTYTSENGVEFGAKFKLNTLAFNKHPFASENILKVKYATKPKGFAVEYLGLFNKFIGQTSFSLRILKTDILFTRYFGLGNETEFNSQKDNSDFYKMELKKFLLSAGFIVELSKKHSINFGGEYVYTDTFIKNKDIEKQTLQYSNNGLGIYKGVRLFFSFLYDNRNLKSFPQYGELASVYFGYSPDIFSNVKNYYKVKFNFRKYFSIKFLKQVLALRCGGEKIFGNNPFFDAAFLGGENNLRGFLENRFGGDAYIFSQAELRQYISTLKFIFSFKIGTNIFFESGRVFYKNEKSKKWHFSYGAGIWGSLINDKYVFNLVLAKSKERLLAYFTFGMAF